MVLLPLKFLQVARMVTMPKYQRRPIWEPHLFAVTDKVAAQGGEFLQQRLKVVIAHLRPSLTEYHPFGPGILQPAFQHDFPQAMRLATSLGTAIKNVFFGVDGPVKD